MWHPLGADEGRAHGSSRQLERPVPVALVEVVDRLPSANAFGIEAQSSFHDAAVLEEPPPPRVAVMRPPRSIGIERGSTRDERGSGTSPAWPG